ncbi:hypothetical protein Pmani_003301 [Petrolisthes manimaculis]|uniref:Uncharacterized protein n=1 Tax=Petrolisthes manimaculis TaxID=1843537 RepID=A0AAE1QH28_9EUCA|nr:hypothetical protein Pmani_003301 [Petrolisthes manimaculis]
MRIGVLGRRRGAWTSLKVLRVRSRAKSNTRSPAEIQTVTSLYVRSGKRGVRFPTLPVKAAVVVISRRNLQENWRTTVSSTQKAPTTLNIPRAFTTTPRAITTNTLRNILRAITANNSPGATVTTTLRTITKTLTPANTPKATNTTRTTTNSPKTAITEVPVAEDVMTWSTS